jgi:phosphoribosylformylglycinamidine cyclo-ligase
MPFFTRKIPIHGIAHITGGGIPGKLGAIIPKSLMAVVDRSTWTPQPIFDLIQKTGSISDHEMLASFNMGIGMILVIPFDQEDLIRSQITDAVTIGHITKRTNHHTGTDGSAVTVVPADAV